VKSIRAFLAFLFLLALPIASFAAKNSKEVTFDTPVKVGDTQLDAGTYKVAWSGTGSQVEVSFSQNGNNVAGATAELRNESGPYDSAMVLDPQEDGSVVLKELDFKNVELVFSNQNQPSGN
jgi:maltodextrin utilization protein YvdJ